MIPQGHEEPTARAAQRVAVYTRVSSAENTSTLQSQAERLVAECAARGYQVAKVVNEVGCGTHDARPQVLALLHDQRLGVIVVAHQDSIPRCGFGYLDTLLHTQGRALEVVMQAEHGTADLLADLTAII
jgi:putative resolvase